MYHSTRNRDAAQRLWRGCRSAKGESLNPHAERLMDEMRAFDTQAEIPAMQVDGTIIPTCPNSRFATITTRQPAGSNSSKWARTALRPLCVSTFNLSFISPCRKAPSLCSSSNQSGNPLIVRVGARGSRALALCQIPEGVSSPRFGQSGYSVGYGALIHRRTRCAIFSS